jgi:hypothetical protein
VSLSVTVTAKRAKYRVFLSLLAFVCSGRDFNCTDPSPFTIQVSLIMNNVFRMGPKIARLPSRRVFVVAVEDRLHPLLCYSSQSMISCL